jgi:osmotically-inducible protein OsmY
MANKNFNQRNQSNQDREGDRFNHENDWSSQNYGNQNRGMQQNYGDVGYSGDSARGMGDESGADYNRVNYFPDNDENRDYRHRDYENNQFGTSGTAGYRGSGMDYNPGGYNRENRGYGNMSDDYGNQQRNRQQSSGNYGNQYGNESDWSRRHSQQSGAGNWGSDYGRQDWGRGHVNTGNYDDRNRDFGNRNYGGGYGNMSNDYDRNRNQYSGNAGNYGRRNQRDDDNNWWERTKDKVSSWFSDDDNDRDRSRDYGGGHRGKGPADYRRSQDRIREDICDRLTDDDRVDASNIRVQIDDDAVILSGTVSSREEKRRAEDLVESISGVRNVENRLRVGGNALSSREYTGNTDDISGIGRESGTTNEIIRNASNERTSVTEKGRTKNS